MSPASSLSVKMALADAKLAAYVRGLAPSR